MQSLSLELEIQHELRRQDQSVECFQYNPDNLNMIPGARVKSQEWWWAFVIAVCGKGRQGSVGGFTGHLA